MFEQREDIFNVGRILRVVDLFLHGKQVVWHLIVVDQIERRSIARDNRWRRTDVFVRRQWQDIVERRFRRCR